MNARKWKHSIDIKQHLSADTSNEAIVKAAEGIWYQLKLLPITLEGLEDMIWEFRDIAESTHDAEGNSDLLDHFNYTLNELYDFADDNRIWMGL